MNCAGSTRCCRVTHEKGTSCFERKRERRRIGGAFTRGTLLHGANAQRTDYRQGWRDRAQEDRDDHIELAKKVVPEMGARFHEPLDSDRQEWLKKAINEADGNEEMLAIVFVFDSVMLAAVATTISPGSWLYGWLSLAWAKRQRFTSGAGQVYLSSPIWEEGCVVGLPAKASDLLLRDGDGARQTYFSEMEMGHAFSAWQTRSFATLSHCMAPSLSSSISETFWLVLARWTLSRHHQSRHCRGRL
jgi:hypothetical protein